MTPNQHASSDRGKQAPGQRPGKAEREPTVLLVDDDPFVIQLLRSVLGSVHAQVLSVSDGVDALPVLRETPVNLIISDVRMETMGGLELARIAKTEFPQIPFILMTGFADLATAQGAVELGVAGFLKKPFDDISQVLQIVRRAMTQPRREQPVPDDLDPVAQERELFRRFREAHGDLRELHEELVHRQKLESLGRLSAGIVHELNTPLAFITSNLGTLQEYLADFSRLLAVSRDLADRAIEGEDDEIQKLAQKARTLQEEIDLDYLVKDTGNLVEESIDGAKRMRAVVNDLKVYAHPGEDDMSTADLNEILEHTLTIVRNEVKYKADIVKHCGELPPVSCYPNQLRQVFLNLLVNAAQAIEERGTIVVRTSVQGDDVVISVADSGKGIPAESQAHIFEPFFTTKREGEGTGLGLSVVDSIVRRHGGRISVKSTAGMGAEFTVRLPVSGTDAPEQT